MKELKTKVVIAGVRFHYSCNLSKVADTWGDGIERDVYHVVLLRGRRKFEFDYTHSFLQSERVVVKNAPGKEIRCFVVPADVRGKDYRTRVHITVPSEFRNHKLAYCKAVEPTIKDLLLSVLIDANDYPISFEDWCADYGYNEYSRNGYEIYQESCKQALELQKLFSYDEIEAMRKHLEDEGTL